MAENNLMKLTGKVSPLKAFPFALQQVLAMFVTNLVPIWTIAALCTDSAEKTLVLGQNALIIAGIATFIQSTPLWKFGSGLPIYMGVSFTFLIPLSNIAVTYGYGAVMGSVIAGGIFEGILGLSAQYWKKIIAPIVAASVVTGIGLSLLGTAARSFGGGYTEDFGSVHNLVAGTVTIIACILWQIHTRGSKRQLSILIGLVAGYITSALFGQIHFPDFSSIKWFAFPTILPFKPEFHLDSILTVLIIYLVSATETIGDASAIARGSLKRPVNSKEITGVLTVDGFGSALGGVFGVPPVTSYSENVGLTIMTGVVNRNVARIGAGILIFCGLFPPIGFFLQTIPSSVIGGVLLVVIGQIVVSGCQMISDAGFTVRNKLIASLSLATGIGFTTSSAAGIWGSFPVIVQSIFGQNVVAIIFFVALLLNLVLPKNMEDKTQEKK